MFKFKDLSINRKLRIIIFLTAISAQLLTFIFLAITYYNTEMKRLQNNTKIQAKLISEYCISPLAFEDIEGVNDVIQKSESLDFISKIYVFDPNNEVITKFEKEQISSIEDRRFFVIEENIIHQGKSYGFLQIIANKDQVNDMFKKQIIYLVIIFIVIAFIVYNLASRFQKIISNPIISLSEVTKSITEKQDYSIRVAKQQNDEIGELFTSFNEMIYQVEKHSSEKNSAIHDLKVQYDRFLGILNSFPQSIYVVNPKTYEILFANSTLSNLFGKPLIGQKCYKVLQDHESPCHFCTLTELKKVNDSIEWEHYNKVLGKHFFITDKLITWSDGQIVKLEISRDITNRKIMEIKLSENEKRMRNIINFIPDAIIIVDKFKTIKFVNKIAEQLYHKNYEELIGQNIDLPISTDEVLETNLRIESREVFVELRSINIMWEGVASYQILIRDISKRLEDKKQRESLEKQLQQSQKMESFGALAGGVAHDFNNILTIINGNCELALASFPENDPTYSIFDDIYKAGERASSLTRQLLAFSRKQVLDKKTVNINNLITEMYKMLKRLIGEDYELQNSLESDIKLIKADPGQIEQVIMNLVINSRDASRKVRSKIEIISKNIVLESKDSASENSNYVLLTIRDDGTGMPQEVKERIFEPFFTTKVVGSGTGLGLSVVFGIIKQHNGWIEVESTVGVGTSFNIYFPTILESNKDVSIESNPLDFYRGDNEEILLIEDDHGVRKIAVTLLTKFNYNVTEAQDVTSARNIFLQNPTKYKLIISDIVLPDGSGVFLMKDFIKTNNNLKILLNSGYTANKINIEEIQNNNFNFIQKPYEIREFLKVVKNIIT